MCAQNILQRTNLKYMIEAQLANDLAVQQKNHKNKKKFPKHGTRNAGKIPIKNLKQGKQEIDPRNAGKSIQNIKQSKQNIDSRNGGKYHQNRKQNKQEINPRNAGKYNQNMKQSKKKLTQEVQDSTTKT